MFTSTADLVMVLPFGLEGKDPGQILFLVGHLKTSQLTCRFDYDMQICVYKDYESYNNMTYDLQCQGQGNILFFWL